MSTAAATTSFTRFHRYAAADRGRTRTSWLDSRHSFSFGAWQDPARTGFGPLLVLNDDFVAPASGFATHGHRDMEILTWVVDGALVHRDDLGSQGTLRAGEVQRMSAGTGIRHSEWNASDTEDLRFLQIWIRPDHAGSAPSWQQRGLADLEADDALVLVASRDGRRGSLALDADVDVLVARPAGGRAIDFEGRPGRGLWVQAVRGDLVIHGIGAGVALSHSDDVSLSEGDGVAISEGDGVAIAWASASPASRSRLTLTGSGEALLLDLPLR
jgi:hypothetical protein